MNPQDNRKKGIFIYLHVKYHYVFFYFRSNTALNQKYHSHMKRINFNNINEIKHEFVSQLPKDEKHLLKEFEDKKINLLGLEDSICYSNTTIKKLVSYTTDPEIKEPMSVIDFLNTIKEDPDENYNDVSSMLTYTIFCYGFLG